MTDGLSYQGWKCIPAPKRYHEAKPREEEDAAVDIDKVENRNGPGFAVDGVHVRADIQVGESERHAG